MPRKPWMNGKELAKRGPGVAFRVLIIGGTGQVGGAVVRALTAEPSCAEVVMVNRRATSLTADPRVRQVILDTAAGQFPAEVARLAQRMVAQGDPVHGASCVGVGKGSLKWSEEELKALEIGVVGGFARGCHAGGITRFALLSAAGSSAKSRIRYARVMGLKEEGVLGVGFKSLAIFRPGIIGGNAHTPGYAAWVGRLIPGRLGTVRAAAWAGLCRRIHQQPGPERRCLSREWGDETQVSCVEIVHYLVGSGSRGPGDRLVGWRQCNRVGRAGRSGVSEGVDGIDPERAPRGFDAGKQSRAQHHRGLSCRSRRRTTRRRLPAGRSVHLPAQRRAVQGRRPPRRRSPSAPWRGPRFWRAHGVGWRRAPHAPRFRASAATR